MDNSNNGLPHPDQSDTRTQDFWRNLNANINGIPSATTQSDGAGLSDYAKAVGSGALDLVGGIGELAKGVQRYGAENAGKSAWGNVASTIAPLTKPVSAVGELAQSGSEKLTSSMSQGAKDAMGRSLVAEDANGNLTLGDGIGDVDVWAMKMANGIGSLLPTLATGGITGAAARVAIGRSVAESMIKRGATKEVAEAVAAKTVERFATTGATTAGVTGSVGSTGQQAKEGVLGMSFDELKGSETFRDAFHRIDGDQQTAHLSDLDKLTMAREETANAASQYAMGDVKTWGAAAIGTMMGDTMLFKMLAGKGVGGGVLRGMGKGAAGEGVSEALESGTQQYVANQAQNDVANANIDPMQGVKIAAIEGGVIGAGIGGGVGGIGGLRGGHEQAQPEADSSAEQQPDGQPEAPTPEQTFAPEQAPAESATQPGQQAAEDNQSPLGPSTSKFDPLRDIPAYQRQGFVRGGQDFQGTPIVPLEGELLDRGTGVMPLSDSTELGDPVNRSPRYEAAPNRAALEGQSNEVASLPYTPAPQQIGQSDTIFAGGEPGADQRNSAYTPPRLSRDHVDTSLGEQSTRDPRSPVSQSIANAGSATDSVFGPLQSLRVTRKGKPFATEKEAALASRRGQEMPVPLNGGGFGVAQIAEVQQVQAKEPAADTESPAINTPADQPVADVSAETVTAPVQAEASQIKQQSSNPEPLDAAKPVAETEQRGLSEEDLKDRDLLKEHAGRWKYRSSVGSGWFTANTKEGAVERAQEAYRKAMSKGESVPTRDERFVQANEDLFSEMDRRYGKMPMPELEAEYRRLGGAVSDLQRAGAGEFNGNGGRRTGAAVSNEGARQTGDERLRLGIYMKMRQEREGVSNDTPTVAPVSSEQQGNQPGAGEPVLPVAEPSTGDGAGVPAADNAGGAAPDAASMESQQDDQALNWSAPKSTEDYRKAQGRLFAGDMSYAEFKAMSRAMLDNAGALRAELEQKTKAELLQMMSAFNAARYKNEKKAAVVEAAYNQLLGDLRWAANGSSNTISETYALGGKRQSIEERVSSALDGLTEARYQQFIDKQHADMAELERRRAALKQALTDPQTLEDFRAFVERRGSDKLTTEQRARYEDLVAASNMDKREAARDAKAETKVTATTAGDIIQTTHSKTGEDLFVVQMGDRVDRDTYNTVNAKAKEMGGWYSSFRGKGAVPGFQFKDKAKAAEFKGWLAGETATQAKPDAAPTEITEPSNDGGKGKQVDTLRQRADSVRAKAEAALNAERKENTAKRAGQAAHARANAERDLRFADLLDAIATGIEAGEITYLRNLANGAQLEELQSALNRGLWNLPSTKVDELVSQGVIERDNNSRYSWSDKATPEQQVEGVTMPGMDYYTDRLRDAAFKMQSASGFKQAGVKIMSLVKAAINRDSKRVTMSDPELIAKLKAFVNGSEDFSTSTIKDQIAGYSRLERMGITNQTELRAALRELVRLQKGLDKRAPQSDPLAEKTRNLKLRLLNNRNAFIDFFPTTEEHAADLAARAGIEPGMKVLEPSAGHGMLADAARAAGASVDAVELASDLRDILQTKGYPLVGTDFMATEAKGDYDAVIMNPPFSNDMDIDHVRHAYDHLKPGGRLVAIVSAMAGERSNRKNKAFAEWLESLGAEQEMMPEVAFKDSLNPTSVRTKIITIEKPSDAVQGPTIKAGSRTTLHTPKGKPVEVQYRLMEAGDLVASHEFDGTVNRAYPQEMQPRDRSKGTYQVQVRQIANNPEGQRLGASPETDRGAPIVRDGVVESGNGRTIGLKQAYRQGSADNYRSWLVAHASDFGLSPDEVAAMSQPVLVRERLTEMDASERRDFVVDSNTDAKMANSASEDAKADAGRLDDRLLGMLNIPEGGNLLALSNEPFLNAFARAIGENSLNQYKDDKGRWNDAYQRRVANAIFAYGYDSDSLLKAATGDSDSAGKNLTSAMMNNAAKVAELRAAMPDHAQDLVALLTEAVETMNSARRNGQSIAEVVSQGDMMSGGVSHAGGALAEMLADASRSAKRLTETVGAILDMLNESASHAGQVDMLTGEPARTITAEEAINAQAREYRLRKEREQAAPRSIGDLFGVAGPRNDHGKDSGVSGSAGQGQEQSSSGGLTVEGVSITIPTIDQALQERYNSVTYRGKGPDVVAGIRAEVGRILLTLKESGLLETPDQKSLAQKQVQRWADEEAGNAIKKMRFGVQNPSWMITGRSGRRQGSNSALDAENRREAEHHKEQSARIQRAKAALKELRLPEIIRAETFKNEWRSARAIIAEMGSYITSNRTALLAEYRKSVNKTLMDHLNAMQEADPARFSAELSAQDQRLRDAGMTGLVEVVGPRSNPGKLIAQNIDAQGVVRFSKQSQTEGAIPTKHLTRKEAELVTREWLKHYKGVAGIDIQIHATQAEMEQALGLEPKEGLIRRAAFDRDESGLHVAADTISSPRHLREILRHEVLAHYGLANVLGGGEYTNLMSRIIASKDDPSMRDVWQWVETHYADEDIGVQAEEVIAHLAELEPSAWRRGWEKVVNWLTKALRAVGFLPSSHVSSTEIRSLVEALGNELQGGKSKPEQEGPRFSQEAGDSDIRMSQEAVSSGPELESAMKDKTKYHPGNALGAVKNWIKQRRPVMLGSLTDLQIDQVYRDITGGAVSKYQQLRTQMEADRNDILLDAETRIDPLWDALSKQEKADLSNLMHDATMSRLHPDRSLDDNSYYQEAKRKLASAKKPETRAAYEADVKVIEQNHAELAKQYQALSPKAKALYGTMRDTYTQQWETLRGAIEQRLEDLLGESEGRAMAAQMRQKMEHALEHGPYFPLTRYGDYVVKARKGEEYIREHFERRADAEQAVKQYQRDGYNAVMTVKEEGNGDSANAHQLGMEMLDFLDSADGISKTALKDEVWQAMLRMMPDASYAKHAIHRRRVKGASRDAHRAYLNSVYHFARHLSKIKYGHKMQGELDKLNDQIQAGVAGEPSTIKPDDLEIAQQVLNEMNKRHDLNMNPTGKAWAGGAGNVGFLYYIGPSVASAVVNMTQNFTVMLPQLGAKYGFAKSAAAMTQALGDYVKHGKFKAGTTEAWHSLTRSTTLPADERAVLDKLYRSGALDLTQAHSIAAKADTDQQDVKPMGKYWRQAMRWAGAAFHNAEVLNREVAALAAYRLLKAAEPNLDPQQMADRVAEMVYDGHGNYAASNRPRYMRGDIAKVLTQFKIYSQMMTYVIYSNAIKAAKGDRVAAKTLAGVLATHWVMAGVMGLPYPLTAVAYALAALADDDDDRSGEASFRLALTDALGPRAGELLAKGPLDALTNLSIAGRTGINELWWRDPKEGVEGDDLAWHAVQQLLGPVAGIGINLARGSGQMMDGNVQRGLETVLPKSVRDIAKAYRQATEGEQTVKGDIILDDVSSWNVAMQALGFGSADMARAYDAREYIKGKEKRIAEHRSKLMTDYYMARKDGDEDEIEEVLERIKEFNATHYPTERITGKSLALSFKSKSRSHNQTQGGVYLNKNRNYLREDGRFAEL